MSKSKPKVITLCGSARFEPLFHAWNEALTLSGHVVFSLAVYPSQKQGQKLWYTDGEKEQLDRAHKAKIDLSDAILVLNRFAYLGPSTLSEIKHARANDVEVHFLESWAKGCGIGQAHFATVREAALAAGVPPGYSSPIDTYYDRTPWSWMLGDSGARRSRIIDALDTAGASSFTREG